MTLFAGRRLNIKELAGEVERQLREACGCTNPVRYAWTTVEHEHGIRVYLGSRVTPDGQVLDCHHVFDALDASGFGVDIRTAMEHVDRVRTRPPIRVPSGLPVIAQGIDPGLAKLRLIRDRIRTKRKAEADKAHQAWLDARRKGEP